MPDPYATTRDDAARRFDEPALRCGRRACATGSAASQFPLGADLDGLRVAIAPED